MKINVTKNAIKNVTNKFLMMFFCSILGFCIGKYSTERKYALMNIKIIDPYDNLTANSNLLWKSICGLLLRNTLNDDNISKDYIIKYTKKALFIDLLVQLKKQNTTNNKIRENEFFATEIILSSLKESSLAKNDSNAIDWLNEETINHILDYETDPGFYQSQIYQSSNFLYIEKLYSTYKSDIMQFISKYRYNKQQ